MDLAIRPDSLGASAVPAPAHWAASYTTLECSLHQLSPYIGKLKSIIARDLIVNYSKPGQLVVDMFCGSGTVPLEAACLGRRVFASDSSKYAIVLTRGKLYAPLDECAAVKTLNRVLGRAETIPTEDLDNVPNWVRSFFDPRTLQESIRLVRVLQRNRHHFFLASMLGILHHQRPGFLSYPSSHLVPYLRSQNFPRSQYPELYEYRSIAPRLIAKVSRALRRTPDHNLADLVDAVRLASADSVNLPSGIDCVITSPPYMNALDYQRDNRLRLWFLGENGTQNADQKLGAREYFEKLLLSVAKQLDKKVKPGGYCVFVVGEHALRSGDKYPSEVLMKVFLQNMSGFSLDNVIADKIPDIRRSRRNVAGVKRENVLVFRKR